MKSIYIIFLTFFIASFSGVAQRFSLSTGLTYIQQYPDGPNILNYPLPNAEGKVSFSFVNAECFKMCLGIGIATHNFGLKVAHGKTNQAYFRAEPFLSISVIGCLPEINNIPLHSIYIGARGGFYNQWNFNPSWQTGIISKAYGKIRIYAQFSKLLVYSFPSDYLFKFDYIENYYPLGNERWSITAGIYLKLRKQITSPELSA